MIFSTKQYGWKDLSISWGGRLIEGVTNVDYTSKKNKTILRGRGSKGHAILHGDYDYSGSLELWQSEVEAMISDAPDNDILNVSFDIIVAYVPVDGGQTVVDILKGVEFTEIPKGMKQGDTNKLITLPIIFLDLKNQQ